MGGLGKGLSQAVIAAQGIRGFERGGGRVGESDRGVGKEEKSAPLKSEGCGTRLAIIVLELPKSTPDGFLQT